MESAYFESSVYVAIFSGETRAQEVKALVRELRKAHAKICTSIVTVQEVSVICYRAGGGQVDNYVKVELDGSDLWSKQGNRPSCGTARSATS